MAVELRPKTVLPEKVDKSLPTMVRDELAKLPEDKQLAFLEEYDRKSKSSGVAWVLWALGWHFAYFGKWGLQVVYVLTGFGILVWWVIEGFRLNGRLRDHNKDVAVETMRSLKAIG